MASAVTYDVESHSYMNTSSFECDLDGATVISPFDLNDEKAVDKWFEDNEFLTITIEDEDEQEVDYDDLMSYFSYYTFTPVVVVDEVTATPSIPVQVEEAKTPVAPEVDKPTDENDRVITIVSSGDGAVILVNGEMIYGGNVWDFHSGCVGTIFDDIEVGDLWDQGILSLATALRTRYIEKGLTARVVEIEMDDEDDFLSLYF